jgi:site-specific DNA-cytosine methylase
MNERSELTHLDLFSGIGGFSLAAGWAGFRTVGFVEIDPFCREVLASRFGAVADSGDQRLQGGQRAGTHEGRGTLPHGTTPERPALFSDIRTLDGSRFRGVTLLTGGFPCQPFSVAGKRKGKDDDRHLWPEMLRVIHEAKPRWVIGENVAGFVNMALDEVCADLEGEGYEVQPIIIPACAVNAPHRRDRVWIIAQNTVNGGGGIGEQKEPGCERDKRNAESGNEVGFYREADSDTSQNPLDGGDGGRGNGDTPRLRRALQAAGPDRHAPDAAEPGLSKSGQTGKRAFQKQTGERLDYRLEFNRSHDSGWRTGTKPNPAIKSDWGPESWDISWPEVAANLLRMDDGLSIRMDEYLQGVGNAPTIKNLSRQDVRVLRDAFQQEEVRNTFGRLWKISDPPLLLNLMCRIEAFANGSGDILQTSAGVQASILRPLWKQAKSGCASRGWRHSEQHRREHEDAMPFLPYEIALEIKEAWDCVRLTQEAISARRVSRLKALGNSIVPQVAYEICKGIAEIERT